MRVGRAIRHGRAIPSTSAKRDRGTTARTATVAPANLSDVLALEPSGCRSCDVARLVANGVRLAGTRRAGRQSAEPRQFPDASQWREMLRLACCLATERGIPVCARADALLIKAPEAEIETAVAGVQAAMCEASEIVLNGFRLRTEAQIVRYPDRYADPRASECGKRFGDCCRRRGTLVLTRSRTPTPVATHNTLPVRKRYITCSARATPVPSTLCLLI